MIDIQSKLSAEEFVRCLRSSESVKEFQNAEMAFQSDPEVRELREEYAFLAQEFQKKQSNGKLTEEDIKKIRMIQAALNKNPITIRYAQTQQTLVMMLQDCNAAMSEVLGFDFAATAAPAASC